jgi:hypothetical protein
MPGACERRHPEQLAKVAQLRDGGVFSEDEFAIAKVGLLAWL